jgi:signal transduction histidine kinase
MSLFAVPAQVLGGSDLIWVGAAGLFVAGFYTFHVRSMRGQYAAVLAERNRIAREFHDTVTQELFGLSLQLDAAVSSMKDDVPAELQRAVTTAHTLAWRCLADTRRVLLDLRSELLERGGLAAAVESLAQRYRDRGPVRVTVQVIGAPYTLAAPAEQNVFRIAEEAVANAVRHSGAKQVKVTLRFGEEGVELSIADNGTGTPRGDSGPLHLGLVGIGERAREICATLSVTETDGGGTTIRLAVPRPLPKTPRFLRWRKP